MYEMICTRPNIAYAVSATCRYQSNPSKHHWIVVKHILKYLRRTKDVLLVYGDDDFLIDGFIDTSIQFDLNDRKLTSGFISVCNSGAMSWKSSK